MYESVSACVWWSHYCVIKRKVNNKCVTACQKICRYQTLLLLCLAREQKDEPQQRRTWWDVQALANSVAQEARKKSFWIHPNLILLEIRIFFRFLIVSLFLDIWQRNTPVLSSTWIIKKWDHLQNRVNSLAIKQLCGSYSGGWRSCFSTLQSKHGHFHVSNTNYILILITFQCTWVPPSWFHRLYLWQILQLSHT